MNDVNHQCDGIPDHLNISFIKNNRYHYGWYVMRYEYDYECDNNWYAPLLSIKYCPFCGERLPEVV